MLQYFLIMEAIELALILAIVGVFYYRRDMLIPFFRRIAKNFLGLHTMERELQRRQQKSLLHAKRLNSHLRRLNVLEGKPARKEPVYNPACSCGDCDYGDSSCEYDGD